MDRRTWLSRALTAAGLAVAGVLGLPALMTAFSPVRERRLDTLWRSIGSLDEFTIGDVRKVLVELAERGPPEDADSALSSTELPVLHAKAVFVWRPSAEEIVVYSRNCTDLSCPLTWDPGSGWFYCPCHGGIFSIDGEPMAGPPDRPMYRYAVRVRDGVVEIDLNSLPPVT